MHAEQSTLYGPKERVKVHLFLIGSMSLFVGVLALPLIIEEDLARANFAPNDGFQVQAGDIEEVLTGTDVEHGLRPPNTLLQTPQVSGEATFRVAWGNDGPDPMFVYAYHVQYHMIEEEGEGAWADWFRLRRSDLPREALFTGEPDATYAFRGRACTLGLDCSAWSEAAETAVLRDAAASLVELDLRPKNPTPDQVVDGHLAISWDYAHHGPGDVMVGITAHSVEDATDIPLYSGQGRSVAWDTTRHDDGSYVLRLELRDGAHRVHHEIPVVVANDASSLMPQETTTPPPAEEAGDDGVAAESPVGVLLPCLVGMLITVAALRRRA